MVSRSPFGVLDFGGFSAPGNLPGGRRPTSGPSTPGAGPNDIFKDFLEEDPDIPFAGALERGNLTPNQMAAFRGERQQFFNRFKALIDKQIRGGGIPSERFADFVGNVDFNQEFNQQFGPQTARFAPRTQFLTG